VKKRSALAFTLVAGFGFFLEYLGTHGKCYIYGDMYLAKILLVPPCIMLMWGVLGWLAWKMYRRRGWAAGLATPIALDFLVMEPLAFYTGLWTWDRTMTPRVWFSTVGNYVVYVWVAIFAISVWGWLERTAEKEEMARRTGETEAKPLEDATTRASRLLGRSPGVR